MYLNEFRTIVSFFYKLKFRILYLFFQEYEDNETYKKLIEWNVKKGVAETMMKLFESGSMSIDDVDERAVEMLNSLPEDQGKYVMNQLLVLV